MKYICIAPNTDSFAWQVDLSYHQHLSLGFSPSDFIVLSPGYIPSESKFPGYIKIIATKNWNEYLNKPHNLFYEPINIQTSLMQMEFLDTVTTTPKNFMSIKDHFLERDVNNK